MQVFSKDKAKINLEQYATDAIAAVEMAFIAGFMHDDLRNNVVVDLGTGTGRLAIAGLYMGAKKAIGIEIDGDAIALARENAILLDMEEKLELILGKVENLSSLLRDQSLASNWDGITVLMNPPFGVHGKGADLGFLIAAMGLKGASVIYSYHLRGDKNREYLEGKITKNGWKLVELHEVNMVIPHVYPFHKKKRKEVEVDLYRITPS